MRKINRHNGKGFTLVEMLLVLAIMASIIMLIANYSAQRMDQYRRDRAALQMQQILNAGSSYYVNKGVWPTQLTDLQPPNGNYLPENIYSPYGTTSSYSVSGDTTSNTFSVSLQLLNQGDANIIAGELPMSSVTGDTPGPYTVTGQVLIPGQNLNNARSINFASMYHTGACVPVPACPNGMTPQIVVVPAGVAGVNDAPVDENGTPCTTSPLYNSAGTPTPNPPVGSGVCSQINTYPITNFGAYATGPTTSSGTNPANCNGTTPALSCYSDVTTSGWSTSFNPGPTTGNYWRVCLSVQTSRGAVNISGSPGSGDGPSIYWAQAEGYIFAMTRCTPSGGEPAGSTLNVWSQ